MWIPLNSLRIAIIAGAAFTLVACGSNSFTGSSAGDGGLGGSDAGSGVGGSDAGGSGGTSGGGTSALGPGGVASAATGGASAGGIVSTSTGVGNGRCDPVTASNGMTLHVNPVSGDDAVATGSGTSAATSKSACAFRTITAAAAAASSANMQTMSIVVDVTSDANHASGEVFPITVPANTKIAGAAGVTVTVQTATGDAFHMSNDNSTIAGLIIDGQGSSSNGVVVSAGSSGKPNVLSGVEVSGFGQSGVHTESGVLTITGGTNVHANGSATGSGPGPAGLLAVGTAIVTVDGNNATSQKPTQFTANTGNGIEVRGQAQVNVNGTPSQLTPGEGTVVVKSNSLAGVFVEQLLVAAGATGPAGMTMTGLVSTLNGGSGMHLFGGSGVKVRSSYISKNSVHGVLISTDPGFVNGGSGSNDGNALERLDFGAAADLGHNVLQDAANPNTLKGLCLELTSGNGTGGLLKLEGNVFANSGVTVDCSQIAGSLPATGDCAAQGPLGDSGRNPRNDFDVVECSIP